MWTGRRPLTAAGPLRLTILSRRLRVRRSREHGASGAPTRHRHVDEAQQGPSPRDREADVRLVLRVRVADDVEVEDRAQHGEVRDQAEPWDDQVLDHAVLLAPGEGDDRPDAGEAVEDEGPEVRGQRDARQANDRVHTDPGDEG